LTVLTPRVPSGTRTLGWIAAWLLIACTALSLAGDAEREPVERRVLETTGPLFLTVPTRLQVEGERIWIVENLEHRIISGRISDGGLALEAEIASRGEGPGELMAPTALDRDDDLLVTSDIRGISSWRNGRFDHRFKVFTSSLDLVLLHDQIYLLHGSPMIHTLFDVYTPKGKRTSSFGEPFLPVPEHPNIRFASKAYQYFYIGRLLTDGAELYYLEKAFGHIRVYGPDGTLRREVDAAPYHPVIGPHVVEKNRAVIGDISVFTSSDIPLYFVFEEAALHDGKLYTLALAHYNLIDPTMKPLTIIDAANLAHERTVQLPIEEDEVIYTFTVADYKGCPAVYAAVSMIDDVRICIYPLGGCP